MDQKAFNTPAKASATSRPRQKKVRLRNSSIHGHGLFAAEAIGSNMMVMGYFGEEINNRETDIREKMMKAKGLTSSYFFRLDEDTVIDATHCGNLARFINHSCQVRKLNIEIFVADLNFFNFLSQTASQSLKTRR